MRGLSSADELPLDVLNAFFKGMSLSFLSPSSFLSFSFLFLPLFSNGRIHNALRTIENSRRKKQKREIQMMSINGT